MKQARNGLIDVNTILRSMNLLVMALLLYGFSRLEGSNNYINQETIALALLLCIQTHIALVFERKRRDPFVILLAFIMICYFSFRIFTLVLYPYSDVFSRFPYDANDSNYALIFILAANTCLYLGFHKVKVGASPVKFDNWRATTPGRALFLVLAVGLFAYTKDSYWTTGNIPRGFIFLEAFIYPATVFVMAFAYCLAFAKSLGRAFTLAIILLLVLEMLLHTLAGSRGAIVATLEQLMVVLLAIAGSITFRRRYVTLGLLLTPALLVLLIGAFFVSTFIRMSTGIGNPIDFAQAIRLSGDALAGPSTATLEDVALLRVFARAGFFDYSAELIAHSEQYDEVISFPTYGKSIVDNVLTPGFDVFDQPKISYALSFAYEIRGSPSKAEVAREYHSDQLGLYGELYALFGYASLPLFFALAFSLKRIYVRLKGKDPFDLTLKRVIVLLVFGWIVNSFGFDWIILQAIVFGASVFTYRFFFRTRLCEKPLITQ